MVEQQLTGTALWIHTAATTSRSPRNVRPVLMVLAIRQASGTDPRGDWHEIDLLDLADLSDKAPGDVRDALRVLNDLGEADYRIINTEVWFRLAGGGQS